MQKNRKEKLILPQLGITKVKVHAQKEVNAHYLGKNVRFDLWAYDSERRRYDIEMQVRDEHNLGLRSRYYQSKLNGMMQILIQLKMQLKICVK